MAIAALSGVYVLLLWLVSSLLRGKGIVVFAAGCLLLGAALVALRRGRRLPFMRLWYAMALVATATLGVEATLWVAPGLLSGRLANAALSRYQPEWDGIYDSDLHEGEIMRPSLHRHMYWNGHRWDHRTNRLGFRGPDIDHADVVFLGDSLIYGHGVEQPQTVPAQFQKLTGCSSANLGRQGASMVQELLILRRIGVGLSPRVIVVCSHPNDPGDAVERYTRAELERFLEKPGYRPLAIQPDSSTATIFDWWYVHVALPMRSARVLHAVLRRPSTVPGPAADSDEPLVPQQSQIDEPFLQDTPEKALGWKVHVHALGEIKRVADGIGARVVLMDLGYPRAFSQAVQGVANDLGVAYSDAGGRALQRALEGDPIYLPRDGHWTPEGSRVVAQALVATVGGCSGREPTAGEKPR